MIVYPPPGHDVTIWSQVSFSDEGDGIPYHYMVTPISPSSLENLDQKSIVSLFQPHFHIILWIGLNNEVLAVNPQGILP